MVRMKYMDSIRSHSSFPSLIIFLATMAAGSMITGGVFAANSPEVHKDGTVTFRLNLPSAQKVEVRLHVISGPKMLPMTKRDDGVWEATSSALPPDIYAYTFSVDGVDFVDPGVHQLVPNYITQGGLFLVPGQPPSLWEMTDIPHGQIHRHFYHSALIGDMRDFYVYTPAGYDPKKKTKYPVLYLLHGYSDYADGWTAVGKAHLILDSLIAQGKAKPMIVVMPLGYGAPEILAKGWDGIQDRVLWRHNIERFRDGLLQEVVPQVEKAYPISPKQKDHAIAGLSMGGAETLLTGLNHLDKFAWVGAFSSAVFDEPAGDFPNLNAKEAQKLKLLWIGCGKQDSLIERNRNFKKWLKSKDITFTDVETDDAAHTWMLWRRYLAEFSQLIFK